jgi:hypothetical protein
VAIIGALLDDASVAFLDSDCLIFGGALLFAPLSSWSRNPTFVQNSSRTIQHKTFKGTRHSC